MSRCIEHQTSPPQVSSWAALRRAAGSGDRAGDAGDDGAVPEVEEAGGVAGRVVRVV